MKIPRNYVEALTLALNNLSEATKRVLEAQLSDLTYSDLADLREKILEIVQPLFEMATDYAAAYAASFYDLIRADATGFEDFAKAVSDRNPEATEGAVRALLEKVDSSGYQTFIDLLLERADYEIKRAAADCTFYNGRRDPLKPKYARVPTGVETCPFCIMLASRGFVYHSDKQAGALDHWHANCDCRVVAGFPGMEIDGYDPHGELFDQYRADLKSGKLKLRNVNRYSGKAVRWNSDQFKSVGDFTKFINASKDVEDLQQRCAVVEQEMAKSDISDRNRSDISLAVQAMKSKLIKSVA